MGKSINELSGDKQLTLNLLRYLFIGLCICIVLIISAFGNYEVKEETGQPSNGTASVTIHVKDKLTNGLGGFIGGFEEDLFNVTSITGNQHLVGDVAAIEQLPALTKENFNALKESAISEYKGSLIQMLVFLGVPAAGIFFWRKKLLKKWLND
ncbi:MAG: hypothetical protein MJZ69_03580 [Bacteroidaceae bacterium]|nr:hypothetical protein [Bacteroidaceae bacterium]